MELSDLVTFSTVARLGAVTRAADELNTVQSNITHRVKALEAEIGTPLFERHSRGMTLTGAGRRLLPYAQRMAALSREAVLAARDDGEPKGPLSIGSTVTLKAKGISPQQRKRHLARAAPQSQFVRPSQNFCICRAYPQQSIALYSQTKQHILGTGSW